MSHTIIIRASVIAPSSPTALMVVDEGSAIDAEITYKPSHALTDEQVGEQVARILKKVKQMEPPATA